MTRSAKFPLGSRRAIPWVPICLLLCVGLLDAVGLRWLGTHSLSMRWERVQNLDAIRPVYSDGGEDALRAAFPQGDPLALMAGVMNAVGRVGPTPNTSAPQLLAHARAGGGLACGGMARLYSRVLCAHGYEAREVTLMRNLLDVYDSHVVVEVRVNGRWILYDPTFNVTYEKGGRPLGAVDIQSALLVGHLDEVNPVFHGEVRYPARLESYYLNWAPLFNNVYVLDYEGRRLFENLPPARYWLGPVAFYAGFSSTARDFPLTFLNPLYFFLVALIPLTLATGGAWMVLAWARTVLRRESL